MLNNEFDKELRWCVRIYLDHSQVYFRNNMTNEFFDRWEWFFRYRAARIQIDNPRKVVKYEFGAYAYVLPDEDYRVKLKSIIRQRRGKLTELKNKIKLLKDNWTEIFPVEEHPDWLRVVAKLSKTEKELEIALQKQNELDTVGYVPKTQPVVCFNKLVTTGC